MSDEMRKLISLIESAELDNQSINKQELYQQFINLAKQGGHTDDAILEELIGIESAFLVGGGLSDIALGRLIGNYQGWSEGWGKIAKTMPPKQFDDLLTLLLSKGNIDKLSNIYQKYNEKLPVIHYLIKFENEILNNKDLSVKEKVKHFFDNISIHH